MVEKIAKICEHVVWSGAEVRKSRRSRQMLQNQILSCLVAKIEQNEPSKVCFKGLAPYEYNDWIFFFAAQRPQVRKQKQGAEEAAKQKQKLAEAEKQLADSQHHASATQEAVRTAEARAAAANTRAREAERKLAEEGNASRAVYFGYLRLDEARPFCRYPTNPPFQPTTIM